MNQLISVQTKIRVWYKHTDQMGVVHHSNYICYYEAARSELIREKLGLSYSQMESEGIMMPILEVKSKYIAPAFFDEELTVEVSINELPTAKMTFFYNVYNQEGKLINEGETTLGFISSATRRPCRAPQWFVEMLKAAV